MLMIRLQRIGRKNDPAYRISVLEKARAARAGRVVEELGSYNPKSKALTFDETRAKEWIAHGAKPTDTLRNLLIGKGILEGKKADVFPLSARKKARAAAAKAEADAVLAAKAAEEEKVALVAKAEAEAAAPVAEETPSEPVAQAVEAASAEIPEAPAEGTPAEPAPATAEEPAA